MELLIKEVFSHRWDSIKLDPTYHACGIPMIDLFILSAKYGLLRKDTLAIH